MSAARWGKVYPIIAADSSLSARDLRVYIVLCAFADASGRAWPRRKVIAEMTGLSVRKVALATAHLAQRGHIEKCGNGGRGRPAAYRVLAIEYASLAATAEA